MRPVPGSRSAIAATVRRRDEVAAALTCPELRPDDSPGAEFAGEGAVPILLGLSSVEHRAARGVMKLAFRGPTMRSWRPVREEADRVLRNLQVGPVELGDAYARPVAGAFACRFVGVPPDSAARVIALGSGVFDQSSRSRRRILAAAKLVRFLAETELLSVDGDRPTLAAMLVGAPAEHRASAAMSALTAGIELAARGVLAALASPVDVLDDDRLDEVFARAAIIPYVDRVAVVPTRVGSTSVPAGCAVRVVLAGPSASPGGDPLPFGLGAHHCIGAPWVRELARVCVKTLLAARTVTIVDVTSGGDVPPAGPTKLTASLGPPA